MRNHDLAELDSEDDSSEDEEDAELAEILASNGGSLRRHFGNESSGMASFRADGWMDNYVLRPAPDSTSSFVTHGEGKHSYIS